jgi:hypothetical protein
MKAEELPAKVAYSFAPCPEWSTRGYPAAATTSVAHEAFPCFAAAARNAFVVTVFGDVMVSETPRAIVGGGEEGSRQSAPEVITANQEFFRSAVS